jgi:Rha family phage regulatory protein
LNISTSIIRTLPAVFPENGIVYTTSHNVADFFERRHDHVLESIDDLLGFPEIRETPGSLFIETGRIDTQNAQTYRAYSMTRDGFTILAMGFTGKRAISFKVAYIKAFNAMEAALAAAAAPRVKPPMASGGRLIPTRIKGDSPRTGQVPIDSASVFRFVRSSSD